MLNKQSPKPNNMKKSLILLFALIGNSLNGQSLQLNENEKEFRTGNHYIDFSVGPGTLNLLTISNRVKLSTIYGSLIESNRRGLGLPFKFSYEYAFLDDFGVGLGFYGNTVEDVYSSAALGSAQEARISYDDAIFFLNLNYHEDRWDWIDIYGSVEIGFHYWDNEVNVTTSFQNNPDVVSTIQENGRISYYGLTFGAQYMITRNLGVFGEAGIGFIPVNFGLTYSFNKPIAFGELLDRMGKN